LTRDGTITAEDIDLVIRELTADDPAFDFDTSDRVDLDELVERLLKTSMGDSNLDGEFNELDVAYAFGAGE
jgi:hypothetical protein